MTCSQCGAQLPQGTDRCPSCYYPVPRASFVQRILRALGFRVPAPRTVVKTRTTEIRTERVEVQDPQTGQVRVYGSLDEVPADIRAKIEQAQSTAQQSANTKITVKDASGSTRTYDSVVAVATAFYSSGCSGGLR